MRRPAAAADRQAPARAVAGVAWNRGAKDAGALMVRHAPQPRWQRLRNEKALHGTWGAGLCKWLLDLGSNQGPTDYQSGALPTELSRNKPAIIYTEHAPQMLRRQPAPSDAATPNAPNAPESHPQTTETSATPTRPTPPEPRAERPERAAPPIHASRVSVASPIICRSALAIAAHRGVASLANTARYGLRAAPCAALRWLRTA